MRLLNYVNIEQMGRGEVKIEIVDILITWEEHGRVSLKF